MSLSEIEESLGGQSNFVKVSSARNEIVGSSNGVYENSSDFHRC